MLFQEVFAVAAEPAPVFSEPRDPFAGINPGDRVAVFWPDKKAKSHDGYGKSGTVLQVTPRLLAVQHSTGYVFCVSKADVLSGIRVRKAEASP